MTDDDYTAAVIRAQTGDLDAYDRVVRRFQDMAFGFAYSVLGDFHAAEDAAQEAFLRAYRDLDQLRSPPAFPGWRRRIVLKCCDRITRRRRLRTVPLQAATEVASAEEDPGHLLRRREAEGHVLHALRALPEKLRVTTTLFYIRGYSHRDIAEFLEIPVNTVKSRLLPARNHASWCPGGDAIVLQAYGRRLRLLELTPRYTEREWCTKGHIGYILEGEMDVDFGGHLVRFSAGDGLFIPAGPQNRHKTTALTSVVRLILVEDAQDSATSPS